MKLFVYGTLKKGLHNHSFLKGAKFIGDAYAGPGFTLVIKGLPYLLRDNEGEGCEGELYEITNLQLKRIDFLEGHPHWYERKEITVYTNGGKSHKAWAYLMTPDRMGR